MRLCGGLRDDGPVVFGALPDVDLRLGPSGPVGMEFLQKTCSQVVLDFHRRSVELVTQ